MQLQDVSRFNIYFLMFLVSLSLQTGCGKPNSSSPQSAPEVSATPSENKITSPNANYRAMLLPLNSAIAGLARGEVRIQVREDKLIVKMLLKDTPARVRHQQYISTSSDCPTENHDLNEDGLIDPLESNSALGPVLMALDNWQNANSENLDFPVSDKLGQYSYLEEREISQLSFHDPYTQLEGKVITIHGVAENSYLPATFGAIDDRPERESILIACGKLQRILPVTENFLEADPLI
jgi:hypothetical protein